MTQCGGAYLCCGTAAAPDTAVYGEMLSRQPLRYLLADDPGSAKTIMAGLLIKELIVRGDVPLPSSVSPAASLGSGKMNCGSNFRPTSMAHP
ncbi:MAG: hypothetical protein IPG51_19180 [Chloroflexi bacterium]|nr:hypothetical protein [Chloroflexota bacterium]